MQSDRHQKGHLQHVPCPERIAILAHELSIGKRIAPSGYSCQERVWMRRQAKLA